MNNKEVIPCIFYYYIHYKLKEKYGELAELRIKEARSFLFEWRLPKSIRPVIIKELIILKLVEKIDGKTIKLNKSNFTIDDLRKFYKVVEIY